MRHQLKRKYADRHKINISDHSQNEYRRTQKHKTGWRARWGEFKDHLVKIFRICFLFMVPIVTIYLRCFYDGISENSIYGLWQSENHKLAISYNEGGRSRKYDWEIVQDGKLLIKNARIQKIKGLKDGTIYIEVYAKERLLSNLPTKNGHNYLNMYVRKDDYLTYNGESYKLVDDKDKSITWKDGSKSPYGQRKNLLDRLKPYIVFGMFGGLFIYVLCVEWKIRRKNKNKNNHSCF